jgi:hypothetical protein
MIIPDKNKAMMTMMAKRNPQDGDMSSSPMKAEVSMNEGGEIDGRHAAAQDAIMAMHEKSPEKLMQALANFMDLHLNEPSSEEPEKDLD